MDVKRRFFATHSQLPSLMRRATDGALVIFFAGSFLSFIIVDGQTCSYFKYDNCMKEGRSAHTCIVARPWHAMIACLPVCCLRRAATGAEHWL